MLYYQKNYISTWSPCQALICYGKDCNTNGNHGMLIYMARQWKNKAEFAQHLRNRRLELRKSQEEVSTALGKSPSYIYQVERGRALPSAEVLVDLSRIYREDPEDYISIRTMAGMEDQSLAFWKRLLTREAKGLQIPSSRRIPVINLAQCENDNTFNDEGHPTGVAEQYMLAHTKDDNAFYVRAEGDSMLPHIEPGDLVLIEPRAPVRNGDIVFARVEDGAVIKRLHITFEDKILLISLNTNYPPIEIRDKRGFRYFRATRISREL